MACLQETKLKAEFGLLRVRGYDVVRKDRARSGEHAGRGGGLVCLVRDGLRYKEFDCGIDVASGLEVQGVDEFDDCKNVWHVLNVYMPPVNSVDVDLNVLDCLPRMDVGRWFVGGDWNAHSPCWDPFVSEDARGSGCWSGFMTGGCLC